MHPFVFEFRFPDFLAEFHLLELGITIVVFGAWYLFRRRRPRARPSDFFMGLVFYGVLRALIYSAGPGYLFQLPTYGVMIAIGFVVGIYLAVRQAQREFLNPNIVLDLSFWILLAAMVGSRVLYIIVSFDEYMADPVKFLKIWEGGLVFYGGFLGSVLAAWIFCRRFQVSFFRIADIMIPSVALGHFFGRIGCFSAGCCHGSPTLIEGYGAIFESAYVVSQSGLLNTPLHPTQLYEALGELLIFMFLLHFRKHKKFHGQLLATWLLAYPAWRFLTEMFRGDKIRGVLVHLDLFGSEHPELLSTSQIVSMGLFAFGLFLMLWLRKQHLRSVLPSAPKTQETPEATTD